MELNFRAANLRQWINVEKQFSLQNINEVFAN